MDRYVAIYNIRLMAPDPILSSEVEFKAKYRYAFDAKDREKAGEMANEQQRIIKNNIGIYHGTVTIEILASAEDVRIRSQCPPSDDFKQKFREISGG